MQLSPFSVSRLVEDLVSEGLVFRERRTADSEGERKTGRPPSDLRLNPEYAYFAGLDIEATRWRFVVVDFTGHPVYQQSRDFEICDDRAGYLGRISEMLEHEVGACSDLWQKVAAVGIAAPGFLDIENGVVETYAELSAFQNIPLTEICENATQKPAFILNNINSLAVQDLWTRAASTSKVVLHVALRSGVGSVTVDHGRILTGSQNHAGEIGYFPVEASDAKGEGVYRQLQDIAGLVALRRRLPQLPAAFWTGDQETIDGCLEQHEVNATITEAFSYLAAALVKICCVIDPDEIILQSPVLNSTANGLWRILTNAFFRFYRELPTRPPVIDISDADECAAAVGAALHAIGKCYPTRLVPGQVRSGHPNLLHVSEPHAR